MSHFKRRTTGLFLTLLISAVTLAICLAPSITNAGSLLLLLHHDVVAPPAPATSRQTPKQPIDIGLNENGDLVIQQQDVSLTMAYSPPDDIVDPQERIRMIQRQNCPSISGISLKVSFLF
ncbi:MAG: hypothetical protein PHH28_12245 [Desulfuromonadaceae bacterium]|nr:hypothetical protein [Desulfuromonadaceae bacterium]